jgi:hypothetical protein
MQQEIDQLRVKLAGLGVFEQERLRAEIAQLTDQHRNLVASLTTERARLEASLRELRGVVDDAQVVAGYAEVGIYGDAEHPLDDAVDYQVRLSEIQDEMKSMVRDGTAITVAQRYVAGTAPAGGNATVQGYSKLMLRAYNNEADNAVRSVRATNLASAVARLTKARATIQRLGEPMGIEVTNLYHRTRVEELKLTAAYRAAQAAEKEAEREDKARLREERRVQQELDRERDRLRKEESHYMAVLDTLRKSGDPADIARVEAQLAEVSGAIEGVEQRSANIRAGYVYVISNVGSFGDGVVKIGMTRRLEPMDRVRELGDASVPFTFDVHALIFSEDAVGLEAALHRELADRKVNLVNERREFFYATPADVKELLRRQIQDSSLLTYRDDFEAEQWRESQTRRQEKAD